VDDKSWAVRDVGDDEDIPQELICHTAKATKATAGGPGRPSRKADGGAGGEKGAR